MAPMVVLMFFLVTLSVLIIAGIGLRAGWKKKKKNRGVYNLPPGTTGWPLIGDTLAFRRSHAFGSLGDYIENRVDKYGKIFRTSLFGEPTIVSAEAELNRFVLMNDEKLFGPSFPKNVAAILGKHSMLVLSGEEHRYMKSLAVNFMGIPRLRGQFFRDAEHFITQALSTWKEGVPLLAKEEASKVTFNLMVKNIVSMNPGDPRTDQIRKLYAVFMKGVVAFPLNLPVTPYGKAIRARVKILEVIEKLMEERIRKRKEGTDEIGDGDLLGFAFENYNLSAEQYCDLLLGLLFGGHETSSIAITMMIYFLHDCPKAVEQLREEHLQIVRRKKQRGETAALTWEDYRQMEFSQNVVSETLRLGNVIKFVHRKAKCDIKFKGYDIPKGWNVLPVLAAPHLDPAVYENPQKFDPWIWQRDSANTARVDNYMPFGHGLRNCAGLELAKMEMVIFLHHLVINFDWEILEPDRPFGHCVPEFSKGLPITIRRLSSNELD